MKRLRDLTPRQRALAAKAAALQAVVVPLVRVLGFRRVKSLVAGLAPLAKKKASDARVDEAAWVAYGVARRSRPRASCVPRALVLWALLRRMGVEGIVRFGARKAGESIEAHAWVEVEGRAIGEGESGREEFPRLESGGG